jgi:hypothetical protein
MAAYMFDHQLSFFLRFLSSFHLFLPFLLTFGVWEFGYHPDAFMVWSWISTILIILSYFFSERPPHHDPNIPTNINFVFGLRSDMEPQQYMSELGWICFISISFPILFYLPTHIICLYLISQTKKQY